MLTHVTHIDTLGRSRVVADILGCSYHRMRDYIMHYQYLRSTGLERKMHRNYTQTYYINKCT